MTPWEELKRRMSGNNEGGDSTGTGSGTAGSSRSGGSGKKTAWQDYKERMKGEKQKADFLATATKKEPKAVTLPKLSYPKALSVPTGDGYFTYPGEQIQRDRLQFEELYRADNEQYLSGVKDTVAPYYIGAMEAHRSSQGPYQNKGYPGISSAQPVTDLEAYIEPTQDFYKEAIKYANEVLPYGERAGKTAQEAYEYEKSVGAVGDAWKSRVRSSEEIRADIDALPDESFVGPTKKPLIEEELLWSQYFEAEQELEKMKGYDLEAGKQKIDDLNRLLDLTSTGKKDAYSDPSANRHTRREYQKLMSKYGLNSEEEIASMLAEETEFYYKVKWMRDEDELTLKAKSDPDFEKIVSEYKWNPLDLSNRPDKGYVDTLLYQYDVNRNMSKNAEERLSDAELLGMTEDEFKIYKYYLAVGDNDAAQGYLDSIQLRRNLKRGDRHGSETKDQGVLHELGFTLEAGIDQFTGGMESVWDNLTGEDGYKPNSATQIASSIIREDLGERGPEWAGKTLQVAYDAGTTTFNMAPSILASVAIGKLNPALGAATGKMLMGGSAAGNAYQEKVNAGFDAESARSYGVMIGISEVALESLLGGITQLGGSVLKNSAVKALSSVDNVLSRFSQTAAGKLLASGISEGLEEGLQSVIEPYLWQAVSGVEADVDWEEALYSSLLGFVTGAVFEAPSSIQTGMDNRNALKTYEADPGALVDQVLDLDPYNEYAQRMKDLLDSGKSLTGAQLSQLAEIKNKATLKQSRAKIQEFSETKLREYGETGDVKVISTALAKLAMGETLTRNERKAISKSENIQRVAMEYSAVSNPVSTQSQTKTETQPVVDAPKATTAKIKGVDGTNDLDGVEEPTARVKTVLQGEFEATADGKTHLADDGSIVTIEGVAKVETGKDRNQVYLNVVDEAGNRQTVPGDSLDYGSRDEMLLYEGFGQLGISADYFPEFLEGYRHQQKMGGDMSIGEYALYFEEAVFYGRHGMREALERSALSADAKNTAYSAGQELRSQIKKRSRQQKSKIATAKKKGQGKVHKKGQVHMPKNMPTKLSNLQKAGVKVAERLASFGLDVHLYRSTQNKQGQWVNDRGEVSPNGYYVLEDGSVHVDLNAGAGGRGLMVYTLAHEITHFMARHNEEGFQTLADLLVEWYEGKGIRVEDLVRAQMEEHGYSREVAFEEVVARSCESFLTDSDILVKLTDLKQNHSKLYTQIRETVLKFVEWMRKLFRNIDPDSQEGRLLHEAKGTIDHLYEAFTSGMSGAIDTYQWLGAQKNTTDEGGALYSYAGRNAKTADHEALKKAQQMLENGSTMEEIRQETGWHQFKDGKWRFEIDDSGMKYHRSGDAMFGKMHPEYREHQDLTLKFIYGTITDRELVRLQELGNIWGNEKGRLSERVKKGTAKLADVLEHDALFEAYPELEDTSISFAELDDGERGYYDRVSNTIVISNTLINSAGEKLKTMLHEIQHAIQNIEGFGGGSSVEFWAKKLKADREREVELADKKYRDIFDSMPEELKNKVRAYNRANLDYDYDEALAIENELLESEYGTLFSSWIDADFERRLLRERYKKADLLGDAYANYRNTAGEIEARDTAQRMSMTAEERKKTSPKYGDGNTVMVEDESLLGKAYSAGNQGYGGIREALAKIGLDELSKKLGNRFPLSAEFEKTIKADNTPLIMETVLRNSVTKGERESAFRAAKRAFNGRYGSRTNVFVRQLNTDVVLYANVAKESVSKEIGRSNEQLILDIMPYIGEILENSILLSVERVVHTHNKGTVLYGYRLFNLYWYSDGTGENKSLCCAISTVTQNMEQAEGYIIQSIENVTIGHGLPGNNTGMSAPPDGDTYTVAQLYDFVKRIPRSNGGLKYSPEDRSTYLFPYTERNDGTLYSKRTGDSLQSILMSMEPALVENKGEQKLLERYQADSKKRSAEVQRQQKMEAELAQLEASEIPNESKIKALKERLIRSYNLTEALDQRMIAAETRLKSLAEGKGRLGKTADSDLLTMSPEALRERVAKVEQKLADSYIRQDELAQQRDNAKAQSHRSSGTRINRKGLFTFTKELMRKNGAESLATDRVKAKTDELGQIFDKAAEIHDRLGAEVADTYILLSVEGFARDLTESGTLSADTIALDVLAEAKKLMEGSRLHTVMDQVTARYEDLLRQKDQRLEEQKRKAVENEEKIVAKYREARAKSVEGRKKTVVRNKIRKNLQELNTLLSRGNKKKNVKNGMQDVAASLLAYGDVLFSSENNVDPETMVRNGIMTDLTDEESKILNEYVDLLEKRDGFEKRIAAIEKHRQGNWVARAADLKHSVDAINRRLAKADKTLSGVFQRERARMSKITFSSLLHELTASYKALENAQDAFVRGAYISQVYDRLVAMESQESGTYIKDMNLSQLEDLYNAVKMVMTSIKNANKLFREGKAETLAQMVDRVQNEIRALYRKRGDPNAIGGKITDIVSSFVWNELKPYYAFDRIGSEGLMELFWDVIKAESGYGLEISEAGTFIENLRRDQGYKEWDMDTVTTFQTEDGLEFKVTLGDMMSIYAYSRRDQAFKHMSVGGFVFNVGQEYKDNGKKLLGKKRVRNADIDTYRMTDGLLHEIIGALTPEQKAYTESMQDYLTKLGEKGNEVSRQLYGIDLFKEKFYFPLKSSADFRSSAEQQLGATQTTASLVNTGMAKETVPNASNPIVLERFDDVAVRHIDQMLKYHNYVLPIENLRKVMDYTVLNEDTWDASVKRMLKAVYGQGATSYLEQWITDLNGSTNDGGVQNPLSKFFARSKKVAVAGNLSVVVQQYFSITRAASEINPKYFVPFKGSEASKSEQRQWEELKQWAGVAVIKEMGGFDMGSARTAKDYIGSAETKTGIVDAVDNAMMWGASKMDELGWGTIWRAVKKEVADTKGLTPGTEEFFRAAGERFTEVIVKTQVYDSVTARSGFMRSKRDSVKYLVSFLGEPTTVVNMMFSSQAQLVRAQRFGTAAEKKQAFAKCCRTGTVLVFSSVLGCLAKSLVYAMRDDEETESLWERYWKQFGMALRSDMNPMGMIPVGRDILSLLEGWDVERPDMGLINDFIVAFRKAIKGDKPLENWTNFTMTVFNLIGIPVKNVVRDGKAFVRLYGDFTDDLKVENGGASFWRGFSDEELSKDVLLYAAIVNGQTAKLEKIKEGYYKEYKRTGEKVFYHSEYVNAVRKALRVCDPRIHEAALARIDGDITAYMNIAQEIKGEGHFSLDDIGGAINSEISVIRALQEGKEPSEPSTPPMYTAEDYMASVLDEPDTAEAVREYIIDRYVISGKTEAEAESAFYGDVRTTIKEDYQLGTVDYGTAYDYLTRFGGSSENEAYWLMDKWDYSIENGSTDGYSKYNDLFSAVETGDGLKEVIDLYVSKGADPKNMASQITSHFKPIYISATATERKDLKKLLVKAYKALGYDRSDDIDRWLKS